MSHPLPCLATWPSSTPSLLTSVCLWRWQQYPLGTAQMQNQTQTPESRKTGESGGNGTDRSNWARNDLTWPAPGKDTAQQGSLCATWMDAHEQTVQQPDSFPATKRKFLRLDFTQLIALLQKYCLLSMENSTWKLCTKRNFKAQQTMDTNLGTVRTISSVKAKIFFFFF